MKVARQQLRDIRHADVLDAAETIAMLTPAERQRQVTDDVILSIFRRLKTEDSYCVAMHGSCRCF